MDEAQIFITQGKNYGSFHPTVSKAIMKKFSLNEGFVSRLRRDEFDEWKVIHRHYNTRRKNLGRLDEILTGLPHLPIVNREKKTLHLPKT